MSDDIKEITETIIKTRILEAFNNSHDLIEKLIEAKLKDPVDQFGRPYESSSFGSRKMPYLDYLIGKEISNAISDAVQSYFRDHYQEIKKSIHEKINQGEVAKKLTDKLVSVCSEDWRVSVEIKNEND